MDIGNGLNFDQSSLTLVAAFKVALTLHNNAASASLQHNWVLVKSGAMDAVAAAGLSTGPTIGSSPMSPTSECSQ